MEAEREANQGVYLHAVLQASMPDLCFDFPGRPSSSVRAGRPDGRGGRGRARHPPIRQQGAGLPRALHLLPSLSSTSVSLANPRRSSCPRGLGRSCWPRGPPRTGPSSSSCRTRPRAPRPSRGFWTTTPHRGPSLSPPTWPGYFTLPRWYGASRRRHHGRARWRRRRVQSAGSCGSGTEGSRRARGRSCSPSPGRSRERWGRFPIPPFFSRRLVCVPCSALSLYI